ncbi:hypothetical protein [Alkalicoccus halolimnae]|uniref:Transcriptional regulator n=1 Tax=Alkalicoccus halolimnae TaxID=1667239 RepID=A0A5C7FF41_9BACI|nr:hypothetical protein [Alkalicoccus halolimnae]TXF85917.1 hypothetical protein FTX54_07520 [Alkalicoccus halolimnae]
MVKIRLGLVGPKDSVQIIEKMGRFFPEFELISFYYERTEETHDILNAYKNRVDLWLFSGQAPYAYAIHNNLLTEEEAFFPPLHGSSLLGTLMEIFHKQKQASFFTLDTIDTEEIEAVKESYTLDDVSFITYPYTGYKSSDEIIQFHIEESRKNPGTIALTCIRNVYNELKAHGIPVYRITASEFDIKETLKYLRERTNAAWYRNHQLAILGVETVEGSDSREEYYSYRRKYKELELKRLLLRYAEEVKGAYLQMGDGMFLIFTTRGEMESHAVPFFLIEEAKLQAKLPVRVAVGYGKSVMDAEEHVHQALQQGRRAKETVIISVDENNEATEHFSEAASLTYSAQRHDTEWAAEKVKGKISPGAVSKIFSYAQYHQQLEVTSRDIARWLTSTERNARRILHELEQAGLAKAVGEEQEVRRGRPRKVFALQF